MVNVASSCNTKEEKLKKIFDKFDTNKDEHLGMTEMLAWIMAVEPSLNNDLRRVPFFLSMFLVTYSPFLVGSKGLSYTGFTRIYMDGHRNVDHDFNTLGLDKTNIGSSSSVKIKPINAPIQQGGGISSATQVNCYGNSAQQMGGDISSAAQVNSYENSAQQVVQIPHLPSILYENI
ncbi:hypothetical protein RND71_026249 [Anisodus tanguticus]|uniref:EF-hand domain-containing protein n=1 Tax=Anisodus tanguticus TaxID=243964 RepID=A0AAE1VB50_9SOLA|nr:hypothetical protein RND71_026249 [Anisodus tanguticus]